MSLQQFRVEVSGGDKGRFFDIKPMGNARYEIFSEAHTTVTIQLDELTMPAARARAVNWICRY